MKVAVVGTGYVGLVGGACLAEMGHTVTCVDLDEKKIATLKDGKSPIYEPGLDTYLENNIAAERLKFSTSYESVGSADVVFLSVGTPSAADGRADLTYLRAATVAVAKELTGECVVVIKSTVPVGTSEEIRTLLDEHTSCSYVLVNNPEFLKEGSAIQDFMKPDRVIIGAREDRAFDVMKELYAPILLQGNRIFGMSNVSAELTKYTANCFLATKISFINEISRICDATGADIHEVRKGISSDQRIGTHFLYAGPGYGGSCFPKDIKALMATAGDLGAPLAIMEAVEKVNDVQKTRMFDKIHAHYEGDLAGKTFSFWGVAFKPNTDDIREAPAIDMAAKLLDAGAKVHFYDPVAAGNYEAHMRSKYDAGDRVQGFRSKYDSADKSHGIVVMTEWREFRVPDFHELNHRMADKVIFDARNIYDPKIVAREGFEYYGLGRQTE